MNMGRFHFRYMDDIKQEVSDAIRGYCKDNNLTLKEFSDYIGFPSSTISKWVNKRNAVRPFNLSILERALNIEFKHKREFILYKGEDFISIGALHEIADETGIALGDLRTIATPARQRQYNNFTGHKKTGYNIVELERDNE